jgi:hypothetical protein
MSDSKWGELTAQDEVRDVRNSTTAHAQHVRMTREHTGHTTTIK